LSIHRLVENTPNFSLAALAGRSCHLGDSEHEIVSVTPRKACANKICASVVRDAAPRRGIVSLEVQDLEIMLGLLTPRTIGVRSGKTARPAVAADAFTVVALLRMAREDFERRRAAGEAVAAAILALAADAWSEGALADIQANLDAQGCINDAGDAASTLGADVDANTDGVASFIHDLAVDNFKTGYIARSVVFFATLVKLAAQEAEALSGLALCGVRLGRFAEALTLAMACLDLPEKHPRAYCIAGFCELERGNRKAAQSLLALGARIARKRPEFAEDLRAAQRVLLILHFA
jgi:Flp pilus assembly protein TadD